MIPKSLLIIGQEYEACSPKMNSATHLGERLMSNDLFEEFEQTLQSSGSEAGFELLIERFRDDKKYPLIFNARLMKMRHELGLDLIEIDSSSNLPKEIGTPYHQAQIRAAREVGQLFLEDGAIEQAWPYFRAIGETAPVAAAIEKLEPREEMAAIIEIALYERVNPRKGFELLLESYGTCRAITSIQQYPAEEGRAECINLLARTLHGELLENLKRTIAEKEGNAPETTDIPALIQGRDWLFGKFSYYVDTSHLLSVIQLCVDMEDPDTLELALQMAEYGTHLSSEFQYRGTPPFDNYEDYAFYLRALMGQEVDQSIAHFRGKLPQEKGPDADFNPAQVLVGLLAKVQRFPEAIQVSLDHLAGVDSAQLTCPTVFQLCQLGKDYQRLKELSKDQGDLLGFVAGVLQH